MTFTSFIAIINKLTNKINGGSRDYQITITLTNGCKIDINVADMEAYNEYIEAYYDDGYAFVPYSQIVSIHA